MDDSIIFRRAHVQDHDQIARISEGLFDGTDYLSYIFRDLLEFPTWYIYVAVDEKEGSIVACIAALITDGGKNVTWRFSRVKPSHRGTKLIKRLNSFARNDVKSLRATIECERAILVLDNVEKHPNLIHNANVSSYCEINNFFVHCQRVQANLSEQNVPENELVQMSLEEVQHCQRFNICITSLLSNGIISIGADNFMLMEISEDEKMYLKWRQLGFLISSESHASDSQEGAANITSNKSTVLSAIYWKPLKFSNNDWGIEMSIYGCDSNQILRHIAYVTQVLSAKMEKKSSSHLLLWCLTKEKSEMVKIGQLIKDCADGLHTLYIYSRKLTI